MCRKGLHDFFKYALPPLLASPFVLMAPSHGDEAFTTAALPAPQSIELAVEPAQRATKEQVDRYRGKLDRLRTHHLPVRTLIAPVPFSNFLSQNRPIVKPRREALFSDGLEVQNKIPATSLAKMDYSYVSPVAEPSSAVRGKNILVTFNWGAVWSEDGGESFKQLDPFALFDTPQPPLGAGFCCDQLAQYVKSHDLMLWLMQGVDRGGNTVRLLFARGEDIPSRRWRVHDITPVSIGQWTDEWFDYPDMAITDKHLFISFNLFKSAGDREFARSVVMRFPLDELAEYKTVNIGALSDDEDFSPRFSQGAKQRMFWAVHKDNATLRVRSWADDMSKPAARKRVPIEPYVIPDTGSVIGSDTPTGRPWLNRLDDRITAGWATADTVGFAWASGRITPAPDRAAYPHPHTRVAIINKADLESDASVVRPIDQPHIWNSTVAMVYPAAAPNLDGTVGISLYFGGKSHYPSSAIGVLTKQDAGWTTTLTVLATGRNTPRCRRSEGIDDTCGAWGDYIHVRPHPDDPRGWYVAVHTPEDQGDVEPKVVVTLGRYRLKATSPLTIGAQGFPNSFAIERRAFSRKLETSN